MQDGVRRDIDPPMLRGTGRGVEPAPWLAVRAVGRADGTPAELDDDSWVDLVFANRFRGGDPTLDRTTKDSLVVWGSAG